MVHGGLQDKQDFTNWLNQYRVLVNSNVVYADIDVCGKEVIENDIMDLRNIYMVGFSETIFQVLANASKG